MATKKKAVKKSAPKKKAAPRGKRTIPHATLTLDVIGDIKNPLINASAYGNDKDLSAALAACYFKNQRMKDILSTAIMVIIEVEGKNLKKDLNPIIFKQSDIFKLKK